MAELDAVAQNYQGVFDTRLGFGRWPALINVDFINSYVREESPFYAPAVVEAVLASVPVLNAARAHGVPVVHTRVVYDPSGLDGGMFVKKVPLLRCLTATHPLSQIVPQFTPIDGEIVFSKQYPSAFFGTCLASMLTSRGVDTVILVGCTTSGCIRATAVDAMQYGFRVMVPRECVGDRHQAPHDANLFDIDSKYGDVLSREEVLTYFAGLSIRAATVGSLS
ncbi:MAG: isochorismatase family protein [Bradyrhizobiaceae bacterium]|nr:MAG: isochorismatase family protein [Bradyrhizobiaceae bacterium]